MDSSTRACRFFKPALYISCRYPSFSPGFIREHIDKPETDPLELRDYQANSVSSGVLRALLMVLLYIAYSCKNAFFVYVSSQLYDYGDYASNIKQLTLSDQQLADQFNYGQRAETLTHVSCFITNCSRLGPPLAAQPGALLASSHPRWQLAADVAKLPLLSLCAPHLDHFTPVTKLDSFGVLAFLVSMYTVFLLGCWATIQQLLVPASSDLIMFVTSPKVTTSLVRERATQIMCDLANSYHNYRFFSLWAHASAKASAISPNNNNNNNKLQAQRHSAAAGPAAPATAGDLSAARLGNPPLGSRQLPDRVRNGAAAAAVATSETPVDGPPPLEPLGIGRRLDETGNAAAAGGGGNDRLIESIARSSWFGEKSSEQIKRAIDNCMPLVRTDWWRPQLAQIFSTSVIRSESGIFLTGCLALLYIHMRIQRKRLLMDEFQHEMSALGCYLWHESAANFDRAHAIEVASSLIAAWRPYAMWETATINFLAGFSIAFMFAYYWSLVTEVTVWLSELRMFLVASVLVTRFTHEEAHRQLIGTWNESEVFINYDLDLASDDDDSYAPEVSDGDDEDEEAGGQRGTSTKSTIKAKKTSIKSQTAVVDIEHPSLRFRRHYYVNTRDFYTLPNLRRQFIESIRVFHIFVFKRIERLDRWTPPGGSLQTLASNNGANGVKKKTYDYLTMNSSHNDRLYSNQFLARVLFPIGDLGLTGSGTNAPALIAQQLDQLDYDVGTLEQIYVNFRMLCEHVHSLEPSMNVILAITYLLNYGYVIIGVFCQREFTGFYEEPMFIICFAFTIANFLIFLSADFHANAKRLQPLIWSIIAQLTHSEDRRVRHLRSLWLKQAIVLDDKGGLALKWFGMRITYVYIIQLIIWTATIFVIALKPYDR